MPEARPRRRRLWLLIAGPVIIAAALLYQLIAPRSHVLLLPRASNGVDYILYTHVPDACRAGGCPALYVLDGERWITAFSQYDDALSRSFDMQPVVIVGIGYRDVATTAERRKFDFTPSFGRQPGQRGGADAYLRVLRDDIIPYAEAHLPIVRGERGIAGHSYGGLLAAYAFARDPDLFDQYLIMSPSLWFDDGKIYQQTLAAASHPRTVFLAADTPRGAPPSQMARDVSRYYEQLLALPNVSASRSTMLGETHDSMVEPAIRAGLPAIYPPQRN